MCPRSGGRRDRPSSLFRIAACFDGLENGSHVSVAETERAGLAIERVAHIEQWRGDARLASRFGDQAIVLQDVGIVAWTAKSRATNFGAFSRETSLAIGPALRTATS